LTEIIEETPPFALGAAFGVVDDEICIYLADVRELPAARDLPDAAEGDPAAGSPIKGSILLNLPVASYQVSCMDPTSGLYSPAITIQGSPRMRLTLPTFMHDLAIRLTRL
jgi:hypothetical protein